LGDFWLTEPIFKGRTVALVAGGPSLSLAQVRLLGMARAKNKIRVIAINDAAYPCWFADIAYACDARFWRYHDGIPGFRGMRVSLDDSRLPGIKFLKNTGPEGFDPHPGSIRSGSNSGYQALHLAVHLGAARVILVGYDMTGDPSQHWFGNHPPQLGTSARTMEHRIRAFAGLKPELERRKIEVINTSPRTALTFFRRGDLETVLREEKKDAPSPENRAAG
jgi:hypothetical protein